MAAGGGLLEYQIMEGQLDTVARSFTRLRGCVYFGGEADEGYERPVIALGVVFFNLFNFIFCTNDVH